MRNLCSPDAWSRSGGTAAKVLIEYEDYGVAFAAERLLDRHGYSVAVCGGPKHLRGRRCPLVTSGECPLVDRADVVVHGLDPACGANRAVLETIRRTRPERRVVVEAAESARVDYRQLLDGCEVVSFPMHSNALVKAVERAAQSG